VTGEVLIEEFNQIHHPIMDLRRYPSRLDKYVEARRRLTPGWRALSSNRQNELSAAFASDWRGLSEEGKEIELDLRLAQLHAASVHALKTKDEQPGQTALCLSGGGIRSAAFALGVLQGLARRRLLSQFHYLSTVSGGGYIGAWLTAWTTRVATNRATIGDFLQGGESDVFQKIEAALGGRGEEPGPLRELRKTQTFITPKAGAASPDSWTVVATWVRNTVLNWLVFFPMMAAFLILPRLVEALLILWNNAAPCDGVGRASISASLALFGSLSLLYGLATAAANRSRASISAIDDSAFRLHVLTPILLSALLFTCQIEVLPVDAEVNLHTLFLWAVFSAWIFAIIHLLSPFFGPRGDSSFRAGTGFSFLQNIRNAKKYRLRMGEEYESWRIFQFGLLAQAAAGAITGVAIWGGLKLRALGASYQQQFDAVYGVPWLLLAFLAGQIAYSALTSLILDKSGDRTREWYARAMGWFGAVALAWLSISWLVILGAAYFDSIEHYLFLIVTTGGSGITSSLLGASPLTGAADKPLRGAQLTTARLIDLASLLFIVCLWVWIAEGTNALVLWSSTVVAGWDLDDATRALAPVDLSAPLLTSGDGQAWAAWARFLWVSSTFVGILVFSGAASLLVNVNYFSLNAMYRNRLIRAFLGASNIAEVTGLKREDRNPFDGFAESDNIPMAQAGFRELATKLLKGPFHVVNMTLNLTATKNTAWQERKANAFICSPLHCGGHLVGYRPTTEYGGGISLGTAMSLSGAAVSTNWGYHSSSLTAFIMAIFNVRLGAWLGNPRGAEDATDWRNDGPRKGWRLFLQEILGRTNETDTFVYLSDGGHFENLGLYEMVRRRCHTIVVSDAGEDPECSLEDLGNALRKIFIDLGVKIEFDHVEVRKRDPGVPKSGVYCAVGRIAYPEAGAQPGTIVYIKPGIYHDSPADIRAYAAANPKFPHDSTLNQWFTESQFESYRELGAHAIHMMTAEFDPTSGRILKFGAPPQKVENLRGFCALAEAYVKNYRDHFKS